jgi:hypothetical protein
MLDLSRCQCPAPGLCPVFKTHMGTNPPDWKWCQKANKEDRESYYNIRSKMTPSNTQKLLEEYETLDYDPKYFHLYVLMHDRGIHNCMLATHSQDKKFDKIVKLLEKEPSQKNLDNTEILILSHKQQQLDELPDKPYLKRTNLNKIDAGKYSGNEWAESRAYFSNTSLLSDSTKYAGTVSASWNTKYIYERIEDFENWPNTKVLINSNPEDNVVLCADVFCPCCWTRTNKYNLIELFFDKTATEPAFKLLADLDINLTKHTRVPFGHQFIAHRKVFEEYSNFLRNNNVPDKITDFVEKHRTSLRTGTDISDKYHNVRIQAYMMEMISCFYFAKKDYLYIPNARRSDEWYKPKNVLARINSV